MLSPFWRSTNKPGRKAYSLTASLLTMAATALSALWFLIRLVHLTIRLQKQSPDIIECD